jgi:hypothetical protein
MYRPPLVFRLRSVVLKQVSPKLILLKGLGRHWCCRKQTAECYQYGSVDG